MTYPLVILTILVLGVLFFGKNLPGVLRQVGAALLEFRKGLDEWKETHHRSSSSRVNETAKSATMQDEPEEQFESLGTKFQPPSEKELGVRS